MSTRASKPVVVDLKELTSIFREWANGRMVIYSDDEELGRHLANRWMESREESKVTEKGARTLIGAAVMMLGNWIEMNLMAIPMIVWLLGDKKVLRRLSEGKSSIVDKDDEPEIYERMTAAAWIIYVGTTEDRNHAFNLRTVLNHFLAVDGRDEHTWPHAFNWEIGVKNLNALIQDSMNNVAHIVLGTMFRNFPISLESIWQVFIGKLREQMLNEVDIGPVTHGRIIRSVLQPLRRAVEKRYGAKQFHECNPNKPIAESWAQVYPEWQDLTKIYSPVENIETQSSGGNSRKRKNPENNPLKKSCALDMEELFHIGQEASQACRKMIVSGQNGSEIGSRKVYEYLPLMLGALLALLCMWGTFRWLVKGRARRWREKRMFQ